MIDIVHFRPEHQPWFESLNREWIERHFWMEPLDVDVLQHPDKHILETGGAIFMAYYAGEMAGTVALKYVRPGVYEFTKMAVDEKFRGKGIGKALAEAALAEAKSRNSDKIILYSSTKLSPALALYRKLGFVEVPVDGPYKRSDIKMELSLSDTSEEIKVRSAMLDDAVLLAELGKNTFVETFGPVNTPENIQAYLEKNFSDNQLRREIQEPGTTFLIAYTTTLIVGYAKLRTSEIPKSIAGKQAIELERIYTIKAYLSKQVGKCLMDACLQKARSDGHKLIWLGVWEHNPRAIAFYKKYGFELFDNHPFMLGEDLQTDLLMKRDLHVEPYK